MHVLVKLNSNILVDNIHWILRNTICEDYLIDFRGFFVDDMITASSIKYVKHELGFGKFSSYEWMKPKAYF